MSNHRKITFTAFAASAILAANALSVGNLRTQYLVNPIGVDCAKPHFSWQLTSDKRSTVQTSYQIEIATDQSMSNVVYDSGTVDSRSSANVTAEGLELMPTTRYYWRVTVCDNHGETAISPEGSYFETGLMDSGWSGARWLSPQTDTSHTGDTEIADVADYTIDADFEIQRSAAGLIWGATDRQNYYMWQVNLEQDRPRFRPHVWSNGNPRSIDEIDLAIPLEEFTTHHMRIVVSGNGSLAETYIDGELVDTREGSFPYGTLGMRSSNIGTSGHKPELASFDDLKVTAADGTVLYEDGFADNSAFGAGEIVNGRLRIGGPGVLVFQKNFVENADVTDYSIEGKFFIEQFCAGIAFAAKDADNYYMWQFNLEQDRPRLRPHRWHNGSAACLAEVDLSGKVDNLKPFTEHSFKIDIIDNGSTAVTYIDGIEIDRRAGEFPYQKIGLRQDQSEQEWTLYERAYFDNISVTADNGDVLVNEDFSDPSNKIFAGGLVEDGRLLLDGKSEIYAWAAKAEAKPLHYEIEADVTVVKDAASLIFGYTGSNNYFMWTINTNDKGYPILRRHHYANSNTPVFSDIRLENMTNDDVLGVEHRMGIVVEGSEIRTYIDGALVDSYTDASGLLCSGLIGFRVYKDAVDEQAYWDNVKLTEYDNAGIAHVTISEDFENDGYEFSSGEVHDVDGNNKLFTYSPQHETIVMQDAATASPRFRKEFVLGSKVKSARLYSSALGVYNVFINGQRVGSTSADGTTVYDELMPGWTDYRSTVFYMTHDVTPFLKEGANAIGAIVSSGWWLGQVSHGIYGSTNQAFIGKLVIELENGERVEIVSDNSWLVSRRSTIKSGEIYHGEVYDARLQDNWAEAGYDTSLWKNAGTDNQAHGELTAHEGPTVRVLPHLERKPLSLTVYEGLRQNGTTYGEINIVDTFDGTAPVVLKKGQTIVADFGQNASGWAKFKVKGKAGATVKLRYAEMVNDSGEAERSNDDAKGTLYTIALRSAKAQGRYTLCGDPEGEEYHPSSTFYGFRYCDIVATDDVTIEWITAETISTAVEEASTISVNDESVNRLASNIIWGQRSNFVSVPTDCPQRDERLGWTADTQVFSLAASYNAQVQGFYHKWMRDMRDGQLDNGAYPNVAPFNWVEHGSSAWADAGIILPWNVYLMYGDKSIIEENYESMERYFDWLATQTEGEYKHVGSDTRYGDWLAFEETDRRFVSVAYYGYMADIMSRMSKALSSEANDEFDVKSVKYATLFNDIKAEFNKRYWINSRLKGLKQRSQCAQLMALRYKLLADDEAVEVVREDLRKRIEQNGNKLATGFLGTAILNQTLSEYNMDDLAYTLLLQRECPSWLYSVDQGATTMWERWNSYTREGGFSKSIEMNSFNHYAYGAVAEWMYRYMAGIAPDEENPGFSHIILKPAFDTQRRISDVNATFASNYGPVSVDWNYGENGEYTYNVAVPANTTATLILPSAPQGLTLLESDTPADEAEGIGSYTDDGSNITLELGSGTYRFATGTSTSVSDVIAGSDFLVFPNPAKDSVTVKSGVEITHMELLSLAGAKIAEVSGENSIDVSGIVPGIYLLRVTDASGNENNVKIIKQ